MSELLHIASLVLHQGIDQRPALESWLAGCSDVELALSEGARCVLLCEASGTAELLQRIDELRELPGVLAVNLVHHHAEASDSLLEEI